MRAGALSALAVVLAIAAPSLADWSVDYETGVATIGYNRFRIPGTTGTEVSLADGFTTRAQAYTRVRLSYHHGRETWSLLIAPYTTTATGAVDEDVNFNGLVFPANTPLTVGYTFNSYRLTWRRTFRPDHDFSWGFGLTAKIRDAAIQVQGGGQVSRNTNVGFVPLINLRADWKFAKRWSLQFEADALVGPQGRAEDVMLALNHRIGDSTDLRLGYRIVEGGASVPAVYSFAQVNYVLVGVQHRF